MESVRECEAGAQREDVERALISRAFDERHPDAGPGFRRPLPTTATATAILRVGEHERPGFCTALRKPMRFVHGGSNERVVFETDQSALGRQRRRGGDHRARVAIVVKTTAARRTR